MSVSMDHMNIFFTFQKQKLASNDLAIKKITKKPKTESKDGKILSFPELWIGP